MNLLEVDPVRCATQVQLALALLLQIYFVKEKEAQVQLAQVANVRLHRHLLPNAEMVIWTPPLPLESLKFAIPAELPGP